jgi:ureidoacrylate peracid hydrolase
MMAARATHAIVPNVNRLAGAVRDTGGLVVWIQAEAVEEFRDGWDPFRELFREEARNRRLTSLARDAEGFKLWQGLDVQPSDERIVKRRYSAFIQGASDIEKLLLRREMETVLITGVATNVCCESTARDCMMRGFRTIMVSDANASFSAAEHHAALLNFITYFGDVQSTDEVIARLTAGAAIQPAAHPD